MSDRPHATGPKTENPYCMRCSKHLALPFHESSEHTEAAARQSLHDDFNAIVGQ